MSLKVYDARGRWRNKTVAFRISPEEDEQLETAVRLSGLTKQDYIIRRLQSRDVVVQGNPRVYKALRNELAAVLAELQRISSGKTVSDDLLDTIKLITNTMNGMKEDVNDI
jgi:electron transfer flavoprotein alpha/beta subunit